jgi:signal transduction histidine kinase
MCAEQLPDETWVFAAALLGSFGALYAWLWRRGGERGSALFAIGLGAMAVVYFVKGCTGSYGIPSMHFGLPIAALAGVCMMSGIHMHTGARSEVIWRLALQVSLAWACLTAALLALEVTPALLVHTSFALILLGAAAMAEYAARLQPNVGFRLVALAFLIHPLVVAAGWTARPLDDQFKLSAWLAFSAAGVATLVVGQMRLQVRLADELRRRRTMEEALREADARLESLVETRTATLTRRVHGLESFNRMVTHDLRAPLAGIAGLADLAAAVASAGGLDKVRAYLGLISGQAQQAAQLVVSLLKLSKLRYHELDIGPVNLQHCAMSARDVVAAASPAAARVDWQVGVLPTVAGDQTLLQQVFINLFSNAAKFSSSVSIPRVDVSARRQNERWVVEVKDNGIGFDSDAVGLFEPFSVAHKSGGNSFGIGLTIVRRVIEVHGGKVWCESQPGKGATFSFSLAADGPDMRSRIGSDR